MRSFMMLIGEIIVEAFTRVVNFFKSNLIVFANILVLLCPYVMYFLGQKVAIDIGDFSIGPEIIIPLAVSVLIYILKSIANKIGKGITIPVPNKRFTEVDDDGEVNVEVKRTQELILYMADLEDWLERKGLL